MRESIRFFERLIAKEGNSSISVKRLIKKNLLSLICKRRRKFNYHKFYRIFCVHQKLIYFNTRIWN